MKVSDFMTKCPYQIEGDSSLDQAIEKMELHKIRHLPVVSSGELQGVISNDQVRLAKATAGELAAQISVQDICTGDPLVVDSAAEVAEIADSMAEKKKDCVLVADSEGNFVGIFTVTDLCRLVKVLLNG